jgi:hypothetical protein
MWMANCKLHEIRAAIDAQARKRGNRQLFFAWRTHRRRPTRDVYAFYDAGGVSLTPSQLTDQFHKDVGVGASIAIQNRIVFRVYIGFGGGEGSHLNAKAFNAFSPTPQTIGSWIP